MNRTIHFLSGLPRSGSTLLTAILNQNPALLATGTSGLVDVLLNLRGLWDRLDEHRAMPAGPCETTKTRVLEAVMRSYHPDQGRVVIDKSRSWLGHLDLAERLLGGPVRVLVPVRDVRDILASLELLWRRNAATRLVPWEARDPALFRSAAGRVAAWAGNDGILGTAYNRLHDALRVRGWKDRLLLVPFEVLTEEPEAMLDLIHLFLGLPRFRYNFEPVGWPPCEDDRAHGVPGLHEIRQAVRPVPSRWKEVLGNVAAPYAAYNDLFAVHQPSDSERPRAPTTSTG